MRHSWMCPELSWQFCNSDGVTVGGWHAKASLGEQAAGSWFQGFMVAAIAVRAAACAQQHCLFQSDDHVDVIQSRIVQPALAF